MKPFVNQTSVLTVNAELIKLGYAVEKQNNGLYTLNRRKRGKLIGKAVKTFRNKTEAFNQAWKMTYYLLEGERQ